MPKKKEPGSAKHLLWFLCAAFFRNTNLSKHLRPLCAESVSCTFHTGAAVKQEITILSDTARQ